MLQPFYSVQIFCLRAPWNHNTVFRYDSKSCKYPAIADVSFALLQNIVGWQSSVQWTDVASYQAVYRCKLQNTANIRRLRDSNSNQPPKYCAQMLSHRGASTKTCFYTDICTYTCVYPEMVLHTNTFTQRCLYTGVLLHKKLLHTDARVLLNTDAFTLRSCWGMLLHARAFTQGFFWHKVAFTHRSFYSKYILLCRDALTQKYTFVQTCFLTHRYVIKMYFYTRI